MLPHKMTLPEGMVIVHPTHGVSLCLSNSYAIALYPVVWLGAPPLHVVWCIATARTFRVPSVRISRRLRP
jgi:hypothetical protein